MKKYYLAYGSNLNYEQMTWRCPTARVVGTAELKGWELLFRGSLTGSYLTIGENPKETVPVAVWGVETPDEAALDRYEGYPRFYYKKDVKVECKTIEGDVVDIDAFVYIMHEDRPFGIPSNYYMKVCLDGYEFFGFDRSYLWAAYKKSRSLAV